MNISKQFGRRDFLKTTSGAVGAAAIGSALHGWNARAAESPRAGTPSAALDQVMADMESKGRQFLSVPKADGEFLNLMIKATRSMRVLEVGTSHGYSAAWIGLALEETNGKLTTIEILPERSRLARENLTKAGLAHRVTFNQGDAHEIVPKLDGPFDFVFLDADKEGQVRYFNYLYPNKLLPGGIIAVHNAIRSAAPMKDYLETIARHPDFDAVVLSLTMNDGFSVAYRKRV